MRKYAAASCIVLGIFLSGFGLESGESINARLSGLFSGWTVDGPIVFTGIFSLVVGMSLWLFAGRTPRPQK